MDLTVLNSILAIGETVAVEFKRCGNGIEPDTYESVCSFLNRFGGNVFLGVLDDGTVSGVPEKAAPDMVKNFISVTSNPMVFSPTIYLSPEILKDDAGHTIIHVPLDDGYSFDYKMSEEKLAIEEMEDVVREDKIDWTAEMPISADKIGMDNLSVQQRRIFDFVLENGQIISRQAELLLGVKQRRARSILGEMVTLNILERRGRYKSTTYVLAKRK